MKPQISVLIMPSTTLDTEQPLLGVTLVERAAAEAFRSLKIKRVYAPYLSASRHFRGIEIAAQQPPDNSDILLIDPVFLFERGLIENLVRRFSHSTAACDPVSLVSLGLAYIRAADLDTAFFSKPWPWVESFVNRNMHARIAVISVRFMRIEQISDLPEAELFLLERRHSLDEGLVAANFNRPFSQLIAREVASEPFSPALWAVISISCVIIGSLLLLQMGAGNEFFAMVLLQISSIIDGVERRISKVKYMSKRHNAYLNFLAENLGVWLPAAVLIYLPDAGYYTRTFGKFFLVAYPFLVILRYRSGDIRFLPSPRTDSVTQFIGRIIRKDVVVFVFLLLSVFHILVFSAPVIVSLLAALVALAIVHGFNPFGRREQPL